MTTALTTISNLHTILGIATSDTSQDPLLALYITETSEAIAAYCGVGDFGVRTVTEIKNGNTGSDNTAGALTVRQLPLQSYTVAGTTTSGSVTVTMSSTTGLFVNQSVYGPNLPAGTTITAIVPNTSITLSQAANASGATTLFAGIAVWFDQYAYGGAAPGSFAASTQLSEGTDYWVDYDNGVGSPSSSGIINRIQNSWWSNFAWSGQYLSPLPGGPQGNIKVQYQAGWATIPGDLQAACELLIAKMRQSRLYGDSIASLNYEDFALTLKAENKIGLFTPEIRAYLRRYRVFNQAG